MELKFDELCWLTAELGRLDSVTSNCVETFTRTTDVSSSPLEPLVIWSLISDTFML